MKKLNLLILYRDNSYKIIPSNKVNSKQLANENIRMIFVPLYDNPNAYIPIKPSQLYNFNKVEVSIVYQAFTYDMEDQDGCSYTAREFNSTCETLIDFINAIYNCYKFRGITTFMEQNSVLSSLRTLAFTMMIRRIHIKFYDANNQISSEIDSGVMEDLENYKVLEEPLNLLCEDRLDCLTDILFLPKKVTKLPLCIHLDEYHKWRKISKPGKELEEDDYMLYRIPGFEAYYMCQYSFYCKLLDFDEFTMHYITTPISLHYDENYLPSLDRKEIPGPDEKEEAYDAYRFENLYSITNTAIDVDTFEDVLTVLVFSQTIISHIRYYGIDCYAGNSREIKIKTFIIFERLYHSGELRNFDLLTELEISYESLMEMFLKYLMKG